MDDRPSLSMTAVSAGLPSPPAPPPPAYFHGRISRDQAEALLLATDEPAPYLLRAGTSGAEYVLSTVFNGRSAHFAVKYSGALGKWQLNGTSYGPGSTVEELIATLASAEGCSKGWSIPLLTPLEPVVGMVALNSPSASPPPLLLPPPPQFTHAAPRTTVSASSLRGDTVSPPQRSSLSNLGQSDVLAFQFSQQQQRQQQQLWSADRIDGSAPTGRLRPRAGIASDREEITALPPVSPECRTASFFQQRSTPSPLASGGVFIAEGCRRQRALPAWKVAMKEAREYVAAKQEREKPQKIAQQLARDSHVPQHKPLPVRGVVQSDGIFNHVFQAIPIANLPPPETADESVLVVSSDLRLTEAMALFGRRCFSCIPVRDASQGNEEPWRKRYLGFVENSEVLFFVLKLLEHLDWRDFDQLESAVTDGCRNMDMSVATTRTPKGPFPALLEGRHTMLDVMFVLGQSGFTRACILNQTGEIVNIITQSVVVDLLNDNMEFFGNMALQTLAEVGLGEPQTVIAADIGDTPWTALQTMHDRGFRVLPVLGGGVIKGVISLRECRKILTSPRHLHALQQSFHHWPEDVPLDTIICRPVATLKEAMGKLVASKLHHLYVVDAQHRPMRTINLRDIIALFVRSAFV